MNTSLTYSVGAKKVGFMDNASSSLNEKANVFFGTIMNVFEKPCSENEGVPCRLEKSSSERIFDVSKGYVKRSPNGTTIIDSKSLPEKRTYMLEGALLAVGAIILLKAIL